MYQQSLDSLIEPYSFARHIFMRLSAPFLTITPSFKI